MLSKIGAFLNLVKFPHTVFALPFALIAFFSALHAHGVKLSGMLLLWVLVCMISARTAAMAFNRIVDQEIDARNPRTANRHLPRGILSGGQVWALVVGCCAIFTVACSQINTWTFALSPLALTVILGYSLTKYFTSLTHLFLGLALALAPLGAWIAVSNGIALAPVALGCGVLVWVAGFDILYALQDEEFDRKQRLCSLVVRLGRARAMHLSSGLHGVAVLCFILFGYLVGLGGFYYGGVVFVAVALVYEHWIVSPQDISRINAAFFTVNGAVSVALLIFTLLELY